MCPARRQESFLKKYDEVLLDEYQDSNLVQEILMQTVSGWVNERKKYLYGRRCKSRASTVFVWPVRNCSWKKYKSYSLEDSQETADRPA